MHLIALQTWELDCPISAFLHALLCDRFQWFCLTLLMYFLPPSPSCDYSNPLHTPKKFFNKSVPSTVIVGRKKSFQLNVLRDTGMPSFGNKGTQGSTLNFLQKSDCIPMSQAICLWNKWAASPHASVFSPFPALLTEPQMISWFFF